jgi:CubicO group peptidase (beta-lactamase class C family)
MFNPIYSSLEKIQFNGAVYLETSNDKNLDITIGYADMNHSVPITKNTLFNIASLSKMYTAVMVLQLIEKKVIRFDDPLSKWFDTNTFPNVTIENLLTHTSGIPEYLDNSSIEEIEEILHDREPYFPAGSNWLYTNTNYVLLAKIIEHASKLSYENYLQRMICNPLQLRNTTTKPKSNQVAVGKLFDYLNEKYIPLADDPIFKDMAKKHDFYGDGGIYSTAKDIALFLKGFMQGRFVSREMVNRALTPSPLNSSYGCGFIIQDGSFGHSGGWTGYSSHCLCSLTSAKVTVLLTNEEISPYYEQQILEFLHQPTDSTEPQASKHPRIMSINSADQLEGTYQLADEYQTSFTIKQGINAFIIAFKDQHDTHLFKIEPNLYWIRNTRSTIDFSAGIFMDEGVEIPFEKQ